MGHLNEAMVYRIVMYLKYIQQILKKSCTFDAFMGVLGRKGSTANFLVSYF